MHDNEHYCIPNAAQTPVTSTSLTFRHTFVPHHLQQGFLASFTHLKQAIRYKLVT